MYYVYMIRCNDNSLYTGITKDVERRYQEHASKGKKAAAYTRSRNVVKLEMVWSVSDRSQASKLEHTIKKMTKLEKEDLILNPDKLNGANIEKGMV